MLVTLMLGVLRAVGVMTLLTMPWVDSRADCAQPAAAPAGTGMNSAPTSARSFRQFVFNVATHTEIEIKRSPAVIWPHIVHSNAWTTHQLRPRGKSTGRVGQTFDVVSPKTPETIRTWAENIELTPNRRRVFKLYECNARLRGYVIWTLEGSEDRTLVSYDLYYESVWSPDELQLTHTSSALVRQRRDSEETLRRQMQGELLALKRVVESK